MMLALDETRLLFYPEGLTLTAWAVAVVGLALFIGLMIHGAVRRSRDAAAEPILPWWQLIIGLTLAAVLALITLAAGRSPQSGGQLALMLAVAAAGVTWVVFFYLRVFNYLGRLSMGVLMGLRIAAILLMVLLVFKPTLSFEQRLEHRTELYLLVDASRSMSVSDYPDSPNRLGLATKQIEQYRKRLETAFDLKVFWFDTRAHDLTETEGKWPEPKGDATNITRALKDVMATLRKSETTGLVLMSDGIHNAGGNVADEVAALGPPRIYTVGIGTDLTAQSGFQDISIDNVRAPEEATVNNLTRLTVDVAQVGLPDRSVEVELREGTAPIAKAPLRLAAATQSVALTFTPTSVGRHTYTVYIRPDPAERRTENNERLVHMLVTDPKIRVLYIEGVVRPEYKPLKGLLETDPNVEVLSLVQVTRGTFLQSGSMSGLSLKAFPQSLEDMRKFDVYIIGDVDRSYFTLPQMENLKNAINEGRGLVMLGGYNSLGSGGYEGTAMEEILPVLVGPRTIGQETTPFVLKMTPEGANHPIFFGTKDFFAYQTGAPVEKLPYLKGCNKVLRVKPGASILAVHPDRADANGPLPVLVAESYGNGRSVAFTADTTYQWYLPYKALGRDSPYVKFWSQLIRWLANKEIKETSTEPGVSLTLLKPFYNPGEKVTVRTKVRAEEGRATNFADVTGVLIAPNNERKNLAMVLEAGAVGVYTSDLGALDPGQYKVLVEARKAGKRLGVDEVDFAVGRPNQEFDRLSIDRTLLKRLAAVTGGEYYEPASFGDLVDHLGRMTIKENIHKEYGIQTLPSLFAILFGLFLALVTCEWLLRKYYQLN
jgi:uncharacterized membrane protein